MSIERLQEWLPVIVEKNMSLKRSGDLARWLDALEKMPLLTPSSVSLNAAIIRIGNKTDLGAAQSKELEKQLRALHPWRKGPFDFFGIHIDTEWRSDWKWDRLKDHIAPLQGKTVLDVGCGSGYHCWRMRGAGAERVIGIEPTLLFVVQFLAAQKYIRDQAVNVIPARLEELPTDLEVFDTTFSMGLLYHRRSPFDHLAELKASLKPGGQLVLETLVIEGVCGETLVPEGRYGKMGNIWFIPTTATLELWLRKAGFTDIHCIDISKTSTEEQRSTDWMTFHSLKDFLDSSDASRTVEGYPAPQRAIFIASKPA